MYEVGIVSQFEAAHRLNGDFGPAARLHGHTYRVEVTVAGDEIDERGVLLDIGVLQSALNRVVDRLNYQNLDELPEFESRNTTAERVSRHIFESLASHMKNYTNFRMKVRVWESPGVFAAYGRSLADISGS